MVSSIQVELERGTLNGNLSVDADSSGLVIFAHGSGSSRFSPRNQFVARYLERSGLATLLIDLLTEAEEEIDQRTREFRFDIPLLAGRLGKVAHWAVQQSALKSLPIGYFGASTGAAAALIAAAEQPGQVRAVVSRGGRPDLAAESLGQVQCPSLFIVGSLDQTVLRLNLDAIAQLPTETIRTLEIIEGASHLFEEPGTLEEVADVAASWFRKYLANMGARKPYPVNSGGAGAGSRFT